jgi:hypothetical protein
VIRAPSIGRFLCTSSRLYLPACLALAMLLPACAPSKSPDDISIEWRQSTFRQLKENLSRPVESRAQKMPADILEAFRQFDVSIGVADTGRYAPRAATAGESAMLKSYMALLPPAHQTVFEKKLLAIYVIDGFSGAAMTDWMTDGKGKIYYVLLLNSALFTRSMDDWLTWKDSSVFADAPESTSIRVKTGTSYKALMYGLLHEGAHMIDYEFGLTPSVDPLHQKLVGRKDQDSTFTNGIWLQQNQPKSEYDYKHRRTMNFYRIFMAKALIPRHELPGMFKQLKETPFSSFYSGTTWNEDLADFLTYHHIEKQLGGAVTLELVEDGKVRTRYQPTKTSLARKRAAVLDVFYK